LVRGWVPSRSVCAGADAGWVFAVGDVAVVHAGFDLEQVRVLLVLDRGLRKEMPSPGGQASLG
jgi:hypothetical protein